MQPWLVMLVVCQWCAHCTSGRRGVDMDEPVWPMLCT